MPIAGERHDGESGHGRLPPFRRRPALALLLMALGAQAGRAEEIAPFKLTDVDGYVNLHYVDDGQDVNKPGVPRARQFQSGWRNEIYATAHSYFYHSNLLTLDIGGGPVFHQEHNVGDSGNAQAGGVLYNFSLRAGFLRDKPYTGAIFFSHLNPTVSVAPGQVMNQENVRYGFDFSLLSPVVSTPLQMGFVHSRTQGRGSDRVMDDRIDQLTMTAMRSFGALGYSQVNFQSSEQASSSGSLDLPLQSSTASNRTLNVDTRLQFGEDRRYDLTNIVSFSQNRFALASAAVPELRDMRFLLDGRARHSETFHSFAFYSFGRHDQGSLQTTNHALSAGISYWPAQGVEAGLGLHGESSDTPQFSARSQGLDGNLRLDVELPVGSLQAGYGGRLDRRAQMAESPLTHIVGETMSLSGTAYLGLGHAHVQPGSVVVSSGNRSQVFVEGIDYQLLTVGTETRLQRLIGGRILDGETILVDYDYAVGGTYAYQQLDQTMSLGWSFSRYFSVYFRRLRSAPQLLSGLPTFPLNEIDGRTSGVHLELPFNPGTPMSVGFNGERENRRETISPYRRATCDAWWQTDESLFGLGFLRASLRRSRIEYANFLQDSNLRGGELRYWARHRLGMDFTVALARERDDAGILPRQRRDGSLGMTWQERRFSLSTNWVRTWESQGGIERRRMMLQFLLRRDF